jgi:hypothetical protein
MGLCLQYRRLEEAVNGGTDQRETQEDGIPSEG